MYVMQRSVGRNWPTEGHLEVSVGREEWNSEVIRAVSRKKTARSLYEDESAMLTASYCWILITVPLVLYCWLAIMYLPLRQSPIYIQRFRWENAEKLTPRVPPFEVTQVIAVDTELSATYDFPTVLDIKAWFEYRSWILRWCFVQGHPIISCQCCGFGCTQMNAVTWTIKNFSLCRGLTESSKFSTGSDHHEALIW